MNNEELKKKIADIIYHTGCTGACSECDYSKVSDADTYCKALLKADALVAAGIGDVSCLREHRVIAEYSLVPDDGNPYIIPNVPLRVTQLYSGEEVEKIVKEREELCKRLEKSIELPLEPIDYHLEPIVARIVERADSDKVDLRMPCYIYFEFDNEEEAENYLAKWRAGDI